MAIIITLDVMLAKQKKSLKALSEESGVTATRLSLFKTGKTKGIRFKTLDKICRALQCTPCDILDYMADDVHRKWELKWKKSARRPLRGSPPKDSARKTARRTL
jgi:putative transcriptional regulator